MDSTQHDHIFFRPKKRDLEQKETWSPFLESPGNFSGPESHGKISNLMITDLLYSRLLKINRGLLHATSFRRIRFSVFRYRWTKKGFQGLKSFRGFRQTGPWCKDKHTHLKAVLCDNLWGHNHELVGRSFVQLVWWTPLYIQIMLMNNTLLLIGVNTFYQHMEKCLRF